MPGLLRGVVRTAAVAGTATAVSNRVSRRQAERWQQQGTYPYGQPEPANQEPAPNLVDVTSAGCRNRSPARPTSVWLAGKLTVRALW